MNTETGEIMMLGDSSIKEELMKKLVSIKEESITEKQKETMQVRRKYE